MKTNKRFGKNQIRAIARKYGFSIEFSDTYDKHYLTFFARIDKEEDESYDSGGPGGPGFSIDELHEKNLTPEQKAYLEKYNLRCGEEDLFEDEEHCDKYFEYHRNKFWESYPKFKNHVPVDTRKGTQRRKNSIC